MRLAQGGQDFLTPGVCRQWLVVNFSGLLAQKEGERRRGKASGGKREGDSYLESHGPGCWMLGGGLPTALGIRGPVRLCSCSATSPGAHPHPLPVFSRTPMLSPAHGLYLPVPAAWSTALHPILPLVESCSSFGCQDMCSFFLSVPQRSLDAPPKLPPHCAQPLGCTHLPLYLPVSAN